MRSQTEYQAPGLLTEHRIKNSSRSIEAVFHRYGDLANTYDDGGCDERYHHGVLNRCRTVFVPQKSPQVFREEFRHFRTLLATIRTVSGIPPALSTLVSSVAEPAVKEFFRFLIMKIAFQRYNPIDRYD